MNFLGWLKRINEWDPELLKKPVKGNFHLHHMNTSEDPEIMDPFSFSFHVKTRIAYMAIKKIKPIPVEDLDRLHSSLAKAMVRIYRKYLFYEKQIERREVLERFMPYAIIKVAEEGDLNYFEVFGWMAYELWREFDAGNIDLPLDSLFPPNWHDGVTRNRMRITFRGCSTTNKLLPEFPAEMLGGIKENDI
jgi:hypothetical protein